MHSHCGCVCSPIVPDLPHLLWTHLFPFVLREKIRTAGRISVLVTAFICVVFYSE